MKYLLKQEKINEIKRKYKNSYICDTTGLSPCYVSLIMNRRRKVNKRIAYPFTKAVDSELEIEDLFERV